MKSKLFRSLPLWAALIISFLVYFPGFMTNDSYQQLAESTSKLYSSDHPAIMSTLWTLLLPLSPSNFPQLWMLVLHITLATTGLLLVFRSSFFSRPSFSYWGTALFLMFPPLLGMMGNLWKDVGMVASWLLAVGLVFRAQYRFQFHMLWWALVPLFYGMSVRHNAPAAVVPLLFWMCWIWNKGAPKFMLLKRSVGLAILLLAVSMLFSKMVTTPSQQPFLHKYTLYDLAGISVRENKIVMPSYNADITLEELKRIYTHQTNEPLFGSWATRHLGGPATREQEQETLSLWLKSVIKYPQSYLRHRFQVFGATLGLSQQVQFPFHMRVSPNQIGEHSLSDAPTFLREPAKEIVSSLSQSLIFRGYFYLILNLCILIYFWRRKASPFREPYIALSLSSLFYLLSLLPMTGASDFRYNLWTVVTSIVMVLHIVFSRFAPDPRLEIA